MLRGVIDRFDTAFVRRNGRIVGFFSFVSALACEPVDEPSRLEQRAVSAGASEVVPGASVSPSTRRKAAETKAPAASPETAPPTGETMPTPSPPAGKAAGETTPPPPSERVTLALSLNSDVVYRTSVVGLVAFPMSDKPTGYAREEEIRMLDCTGTGPKRACRVQHRFVGFEAEPPAGRFLEGDYKRVAHVQSEHAITGTGVRSGAATISAVASDDPAAPTTVDPPLAADLSDVHRLFCIRFPDEAVGVGAKWSDTCKTVTAGVAGTRTVSWELSKLEDDPAGGTRAELSYVGQYVQTVDRKAMPGANESTPPTTVERKGTVQGTLYFFVDDGEPHLMREQISLPIGRTGVVVKTTVNIQFAHANPDDPSKRTRTDGAPFPIPAAP